MKSIKKHYELLLILMTVVLVSGCMTQSNKPSQPSEPIRTVEKKPQLSIEQRIERWLRQAETALRRNRLTKPSYDNAYDRYQSVLRYAPDNIQAKTGLQQIQIKYIQLARTAAGQQKFDRAFAHLRSAERAGAEAAALSDFRAEIEALQKQASLDAVSEYSLPGELVTNKAPELINHLGLIARRIEMEDKPLMIIARNDQEGRWIYRQMRSAVSGYRLRADIRIGATPKVVVLDE